VCSWFPRPFREPYTSAWRTSIRLMISRRISQEPGSGILPARLRVIIRDEFPAREGGRGGRPIGDGCTPSLGRRFRGRLGIVISRAPSSGGLFEYHWLLLGCRWRNRLAVRGALNVILRP